MLTPGVYTIYGNKGGAFEKGFLKQLSDVDLVFNEEYENMNNKLSFIFSIDKNNWNLIDGHTTQKLFGNMGAKKSLKLMCIVRGKVSFIIKTCSVLWKKQINKEKIENKLRNIFLQEILTHLNMEGKTCISLKNQLNY